MKRKTSTFNIWKEVEIGEKIVDAVCKIVWYDDGTFFYSYQLSGGIYSDHIFIMVEQILRASANDDSIKVDSDDLSITIKAPMQYQHLIESSTQFIDSRILKLRKEAKHAMAH